MWIERLEQRCQKVDKVLSNTMMLNTRLHVISHELENGLHTQCICITAALLVFYFVTFSIVFSLLWTDQKEF